MESVVSAAVRVRTSRLQTLFCNARGLPQIGMLRGWNGDREGFV
jgi:hypothetical protein